MIPSSFAKFLLGFAILLLVGCGGGSTDDNSPDTNSDTSTDKWNEVVWDKDDWS